MTKADAFLSELDEAVSRGTPESRARALWHTTDLMIAGHYSEDEIWTFGAVIGRLADEIEVAARAKLAKRLAHFDDAPVNVIHKLAFDDSIDVAGPVLKESERLEPYAMVANVCLKSQSHLLAISKRETLVEINYEFQPQRAPEIRKTHMRRQRFQLGCGVERKGRA